MSPDVPPLLTCSNPVFCLWGAGSGPIEALTLFTSLVCVCIVAGHLLEGLRWLNESVVSIMFGMLVGVVVLLVRKGRSSLILRFDEEVFFLYLLPPIIFNAGFQVKKKQFFRNFGAIMAYGIAGVFISFGVIAAGCQALFRLVGLPEPPGRIYLVLGAIFSATDSVCTLQVLNQEEQPLVYSLVFGEGIVNDATSVVLFRAVQRLGSHAITLGRTASVLADFCYLFVSSTVLGIVIGLFSAFLIRKLYLAHHSTDREIALVASMAYLSYIVSEQLQLSGILSVFFAGITMSHYTWHNVTESSRVTTKHAFATLSFLAETFIFIYVGMDALDTSKLKGVRPGPAAALFFLLLLLVMVSRAAFVFPLSALLNLRRNPSRHVQLRHQVVVWWSGLMRGAVSIALSYEAFSDLPDQGGEFATMIVSIMAVVLFSTVVFGLLTSPLINFFLPHTLLRYSSTLSDSAMSPKASAAPSHPPGSPPSYAPPPFQPLRWSIGLPEEPPAESAGASACTAAAISSRELPASLAGLSAAAAAASLVTEVEEVALSGGSSAKVKAEEAVGFQGGQGLLERAQEVQVEVSERTNSKSPDSRASLPAPLLEGTAVAQLHARFTLPLSSEIQRLFSARERDVHDWWRWFDDSYMRPVFGGRGFDTTAPSSLNMHYAGLHAAGPLQDSINSASTGGGGEGVLEPGLSAVLPVPQAAAAGEPSVGAQAGSPADTAGEAAHGSRRLSGSYPKQGSTAAGPGLRRASWQSMPARRGSLAERLLPEEGGAVAGAASMRASADNVVEWDGGRGLKLEDEGDAIEGEDLSSEDTAWPGRMSEHGSTARHHL